MHEKNKISTPEIAIMAVVVGLLPWLMSCLGFVPIQNINTPSFFGLILTTLNQQTSPIISAVMVLLIGLSLIMLNRKYLFINKETLLPTFFFIALTAINVKTHQFCMPDLSVILVYMAIGVFLKARDKSDITIYAFDISCIISLSSLLCFATIYYIVLFIKGLMMFKGFEFRTFLAIVIGITFPYVLSLGILYILDSTFLFGEFLSSAIMPQISIPDFNIYMMLVFIAILSILTISLIAFATNSYAYKPASRKTIAIFYVFLLLSIILRYVYSQYYLSLWPIISIFAAICIANYFVMANSKLSKDLFYAFCFVSLIATTGQFFAF